MVQYASLNEGLHKKLAVLYHIFYEDTIRNIKEELKGIESLHPFLFFNICSDTPGQVEIKEKLSILFPGSLITISSNKGKDIGGKLLLIKAFMLHETQADWIVFLHDKKSYQALNAKEWRTELFKIINETNVKSIQAIIVRHPDCGIVAMRNYVRQEVIEGSEFVGNNGRLLGQLKQQYGLNAERNEYVAGTMFWAKASCFKRFFDKYDPLAIRQSLESGNVIDNFSGTLTHSWERMFSWIVTSEGFKIKMV